MDPHRIVIVGRGAGGLVVATHLDDKFGKSKRAQVTLVDVRLTHPWKMKLHQQLSCARTPAPRRR